MHRLWILHPSEVATCPYRYSLPTLVTRESLTTTHSLRMKMLIICEIERTDNWVSQDVTGIINAKESSTKSVKSSYSFLDN